MRAKETDIKKTMQHTWPSKTGVLRSMVKLVLVGQIEVYGTDFTKTVERRKGEKWQKRR